MRIARTDSRRNAPKQTSDFSEHRRIRRMLYCLSMFYRADVRNNRVSDLGRRLSNKCSSKKPEFNIGSPIPLLVLPSQACSAFEDDNGSAGSRLPEVLLVKKPTSKNSPIKAVISRAGAVCLTAAAVIPMRMSNARNRIQSSDGEGSVPFRLQYVETLPVDSRPEELKTSLDRVGEKVQ
jgi:hypothetical protein